MMKKTLLIHPEELNENWIRRMKALKVDTLAIHPWGGGKALQSLTELLELLRDPAYRRLLDRAADSGLQIEYEFHAAGYLLPRALFKEHPEYFRMNKEGERTPDYNLCFSNSEAMAMLAEQAAKLPDQLYRTDHNFYFWLDDSKDAFCHCPKCRRLSPSDQQLLAMNAMIEAIRANHPNATLSFLAYRETEAVPKTIQPKQGIFLEFAPIQRTADNNSTDTISGLPELMHFFGSEEPQVLEYWFDNSLFSKWKKPPVAFKPDNQKIRAEIRYYTNLGFKNIRSFACFLGEDYEALYGEPDLSAFSQFE